MRNNYFNFKKPVFLQGFSLIETLMVIFIFTLILGATSSLIIMAYRTHGYTLAQSSAINEARRGIETMIKEIREAKTADNGSYPIEKAADKEFIFYSDIDKDGDVERVRYFIGTVNEGTLSQKCYTNTTGGSCVPVIFSGFLTGTLLSAQLKVTANGDFNRADEYAAIKADGVNLITNLCRDNCDQCPTIWQGLRTFNVTAQASDGVITLEAIASGGVNQSCNWDGTTHKMKINFELSWTEEIMGTELKKGVTNPSGDPLEYHLDQEEITVLSSYVRNAPPIFEYYDAAGEKIELYPSRLVDTKVTRLLLIIDVDPNRSPPPYELLSSVQLRNLKEE